MKILIVYRSYHRMNTQKVVRAMAEATGATLVTVDEVRPEDLDGYNLVGFGSGIYGGKHHKDLFALVEKMPFEEGRKVFVFSTSGCHEGTSLHRPPQGRPCREGGYRDRGRVPVPGRGQPAGVQPEPEGGPRMARGEE